jgi:hypothetical protein
MYKALGKKPFFSLNDMAVVIAQGKLITAYGYAGDSALELSNTDKESMNSAVMNAKMYAEVFRMLGWIAPYYPNKSYPVSFTFIGIHIALSDSDNKKLYEQCVLGINNPTDFAGKMSYTENIRFFKTALRTFIDLGGVMYKHEFCIGPMGINDINESEYQSMLVRIKNLRGDYERLKKAFKELADSLNMKEDPVDNSTRLPIAFMKTCGWIESVNDSSLYNKSMSCLKITDHGVDVYQKIKDRVDIRLDDYKKLSTNKREALIRVGIYSMLSYSGYDLSSVADKQKHDRDLISDLVGNKEILFSPCQTINRLEVEHALGIQENDNNKCSVDSLATFTNKSEKRFNDKNIESLLLNIPKEVDLNSLKNEEDLSFLNLVNGYVKENKNTTYIVNELFLQFRSATQTTFYPLVSTLFKIIGFNCSYSRTGDNGSRWDAIIDDPKRSMPIEIKSPTEEEHISIKAIRQALENKIVLLSRKTFVTDDKTVSLAVGYFMPNDRAEVSRLISDFKVTYGYKIGVIDFKSLLSVAVSILVDHRSFDKERLYDSEGLINASI